MAADDIPMKTRLLQDQPERTFAIVFEPGEEVVAGLLRFAEQERLPSAHFTAIGALQDVTLGFFDPDLMQYEEIPIDEQVELMTLVGNIARGEDERVRLHAHVVVGKRDGTAHGGHLLRAHVRPTMEVVIIESSQTLRRVMHDELGAALLDLSLKD